MAATSIATRGCSQRPLQGDGFYEVADDVGHIPRANAHMTARAEVEGRKIYEVVYTTGPAHLKGNGPLSLRVSFLPRYLGACRHQTLPRLERPAIGRRRADILGASIVGRLRGVVRLGPERHQQSGLAISRGSGRDKDCVG